MKALRLEFSIESRLPGLGSQEQLSTLEEVVYFWPKHDSYFPDTVENARKVLDGFVKELKKALKLSGNSQFHVMGYVFDQDKCNDKMCIFRYSMYHADGATERLFLLQNAGEQKEFNRYSKEPGKWLDYEKPLNKAVVWEEVKEALKFYSKNYLEVK